MGMTALAERKYTLEEYLDKDLDDVVNLSSIDCELTLREIYEGIEIDESKIYSRLQSIE
jgi:hypothetical protein